jgi:hypothetical protein
MMTSAEIVSVVRVLVYTGTREALQTHLSHRAVKGTMAFDIRIDEAILGDLPFVPERRPAQEPTS